MRPAATFALSMIAAAAIAGCDAPSAPRTVEPTPDVSPGTDAPSQPPPGSSVKPALPSPTIEIPPPVD